MPRHRERPLRQDRWNLLGRERLRALRDDPQRFVPRASPHAGQLCARELGALLEPLAGRRILELGCGRGEFSAWLAGGGARVTAADLGPDLVGAARLLAAASGVHAGFAVANAARLPFADGSFDLVLGMNVLHHLSEADLARAVRESHRVLAPGGTAAFYEPVENSRLLGLARDLAPAPATAKGRPPRPSILQRRAWKRYLAQVDDRSLRSAELLRAAAVFDDVALRPYGVLVRFKRLVGARWRKRLPELDARLLEAVPALGRWGRHVWLECRRR